MKKKLIVLGLGVTVFLVAVFIALYIWIDVAVKDNISIAKKKYQGKAEDALIEYLLDSSNTYSDRSQLAVWTLGQIKSENALPVLRALYKNDPEGETCYGKHDSMLCQHELYNAIRACESNWWPVHSRLNK